MKRKKYIDLSHTIQDGIITYKGLPAPIICDYLSREESRKHYGEGTEFQIGKIEMVSNTGTYIDVPLQELILMFHFIGMLMAKIYRKYQLIRWLV